MKTIIKIALGLALGSLIIIGGCVALIGSGADKAQEDSDKTAITQQQYASIKTGMSKRDVISKLGKPMDKQEMEIDMKDLGDKANYKSSCIYYGRKGELASMYQFCFEGDKLDSKSSY